MISQWTQRAWEARWQVRHNDDEMKLLELARDEGLITGSQLDVLREECARDRAVGRGTSPTRMAIERGMISEEASRELETEAWIQGLPTDLKGYRITQLVGRGGMAAVFRAEDISLGKVVAVKVLLPDFSSSQSYLARFSREARIAARLTHPNTVQVFGAGETEGVHYLVMEYVEGETVSSIIRRKGRIPEGEALDIAIQVSDALEEAARMGIVHRDIKPGNIIISKWGVPKLADFGIAKEFTDLRDPRIQMSLTLGVVGTPTYMSPEQARGARKLDLRSDIYSLGATLYHMVGGDLPVHANTPLETMVRVVSEPPRSPRTAYPELSEETAAVICRMMAKGPEDRHGDFEELRADLTAARDGEEVSVDYEEALQLVRPAQGALDEGEEELSLGRIVAVAAAVLIVGLVLLLMMKSCGG